MGSSYSAIELRPQNAHHDTKTAPHAQPLFWPHPRRHTAPHPGPPGAPPPAAPHPGPAATRPNRASKTPIIIHLPHLPVKPFFHTPTPSQQAHAPPHAEAPRPRGLGKRKPRGKGTPSPRAWPKRLSAHPSLRQATSQCRRKRVAHAHRAEREGGGSGRIILQRRQNRPGHGITFVARPHGEIRARRTRLARGRLPALRNMEHRQRHRNP